jgi:hypothetical protein
VAALEREVHLGQVATVVRARAEHLAGRVDRHLDTQVGAGRAGTEAARGQLL